MSNNNRFTLLVARNEGGLGGSRAYLRHENSWGQSTVTIFHITAPWHFYYENLIGRAEKAVLTKEQLVQVLVHTQAASRMGANDILKEIFCSLGLPKSIQTFGKPEVTEEMARQAIEPFFCEYMTAEPIAVLRHGEKESIITLGMNVGGWDVEESTLRRLITTSNRDFADVPANEISVQKIRANFIYLGEAKAFGVEKCPIYCWKVDESIWAEAPGIGNNWSIKGHAQKRREVPKESYNDILVHHLGQKAA